MSPYAKIEDRLISKAKFDPTTHCVVWIGCVDRHGYGKIRGVVDMPGETLAHRAAYRCWIGQIPEGCEIDHRCENKLFINPSHLQAITRATHARFSDRKASNANRNKEFCVRGHPFDEANTLISPPTGPRSHRYCKACLKERSAKRRSA